MLIRIVNYCLLLVSLLFVGCTAHMSPVVSKYMRATDHGTYDSDYALLDEYPVEQQFEIFLYVIRNFHPAQAQVGTPIARRGKFGLDYVLGQVSNFKYSRDYVFSLEIFQEMQRRGYYLVCDDVEAMAVIRENESLVEHLDWREMYHRVVNEYLCLAG